MNEREITQLLLEINTIHQQSFHFAQILPGGYQDRAIILIDDSNQRFILKRWHREQAIPLLSTLAKRGYPCHPPRFAGKTRAGTSYWIQEYIEGQPMERLDDRFLEQVLSINELQAQSAQGIPISIQSSWSMYAYNVVFHNASDWFHSLQRYSEATRDFAEAVVEDCQSCREMSLVHTDAVHGDFTPDNIIVNHNRITGVIDTAAMGQGTRAIDIATLLHYAYLYEYSDTVKNRLLAYMTRYFDRQTITLALAYRIFAMIAWAINHDPQETIDDYLRKSKLLLQTIP
jgi:Ser/Thr protein kinase RdoA (MazF antagonist)